MKIGFDLDGVLDRPALRDLALALLKDNHEVHIISGCFLEAGGWQDHKAKLEKLVKLGFITRAVISTYTITFTENTPVSWGYNIPSGLCVQILDAVDHTKFDRDYRLADLGLRKGAYIEQNGIEIMFDDSELYCRMMPAMCGAQIVRVQ